MGMTSGESLSFRCNSESTARLLRLIASRSGRAADISVDVADIDDVVQFTFDHGIAARGIVAASSALIKEEEDSGLYGNSMEDRAQIHQWLFFAITELHPLLDAKLVQLNSWLLHRTYLVGNSLTLADLVVYAFVSPAVCGFPVAQHDHFCNLLRWYSHIRAIADRDGLFPSAHFQKPKFSLPAAVMSAQNTTKGAGVVEGRDKSETKEKVAKSTSEKAPKDSRKESSKDSKTARAKKGSEDSSNISGKGPATPAVSTENTDKAQKDTAQSSEGPTVDVLDIRVGRIVDCKHHPNADSLYVEDIDLGEGQPRQVVSGLRKFVPLEAMQNRNVVVVCNLKPAKMREVMSYGMVLCASNDDHTAVDPIVPPDGVAPGEKITFEGYTKEPEKQINPKKKIFEKIAPDLVTNEAGVCMYRGKPFMTSTGAISSSLKNAHIA